MIDIKLAEKRRAETLGMITQGCPNCSSSAMQAYSQNEFGKGNTEKEHQYLVERKAILEGFVNRSMRGEVIQDIENKRLELSDINKQLELFSFTSEYIDDFAEILPTIETTDFMNKTDVIEAVKEKIADNELKERIKGNYTKKEKKQYNPRKNSKTF